jgi:predicted RNase H-like HicB family nuclease
MSNPMILYEIIIYWSEADGTFIAEVPELPGCMADGASYKEVLETIWKFTCFRS